MKSSNISVIAAMALAALASPVMANATGEAASTPQAGQVQKTKYKQCVVFYSPQYKRTRIKPINYDFRWCDKANRKDCSKWTSDVLRDRGHDFSIAGHCFTYHKPIVMEFKFNRTFKSARTMSAVTLKPQMIRLQGDLAPHPFCTTKAVNRFQLRRGRLHLKPGKPRGVKAPDCVWKPVKKAAAN